MRLTRVQHEFVDAVPESLTSGVVYVSIKYATAVHLCCCGCAREVVTPIQPRRYRLMFDGVSISLSPSIGNWSFPCQSHYWIEGNRVRWARRWTAEQIAEGRGRDLRLLGRWSRNPDAGRLRPPELG